MQENLHRVGIGVTAPALRKKRTPGTRSARACPSHASQPPRRILRSYRTFSRYCFCGSIDIQVLSDLAFILQILAILAILLQTTKKARREK